MRVETRNCHEHGHPEFVLEVADEQIPEVYVNAFIQTLESMVASGSVFKAGTWTSCGSKAKAETANG